MRYETRAVLAAAYLGPNKRARTGRGRMLTLSVRVSDRGAELAVLCGRVSILSIADVNADDPTKPPTCEHCARRLRKLEEERRS